LEDDLSENDWLACLRVLRAASRDLSLGEDRPEFKTLIGKINRMARRQSRSASKAEDRTADRETLATAAAGREAAYDAPRSELPERNEADDGGQALTLRRPHQCYVCRAPYTECHAVYHLLCPRCVETNLAYRDLRVDVSGRIAVVTGGRIKIGYHTVLRLLRDGAGVVATTRFPADALRRYSQEPDFQDWSQRLKLYALDLRYLPGVEVFCDWVARSYGHLDILINNAAQAVARPAQFYAHLLAAERQAILGQPAGVIVPSPAPSPGSLAISDPYFPLGLYDRDRQQLDMRPSNSWSAELHEVHAAELAETHLINAMAPFILCARLKRHLEASPFERRFIVNVSSAEGMFSRTRKSSRHPHTNMTKAALNMMTLTAAEGFAQCHIYMSAVDPGWISNLSPWPKANSMREDGFVPPLDLVDGAARVLHPVYDGLRLPQTPLHGVYLKDYAPHEW